MACHVNLLSMSNDDKGTDFYAYYLILNTLLIIT